MSLFLAFLGIIVFALILFAAYRFLKVKRKTNELYIKRFKRIQNLYEKLENGEIITAEEVKPYAENQLSRKTAFQILAEHEKTGLFPDVYKTIIKGAESDLCNWLEFPTELGSCPDEIEHVEKVNFDYEGENIIYHAFKFRMNEPHWAAKDGWFLGVAGPFFDDSLPYDLTKATFSRLTSRFGEVTPEAEAMWVHKNIALRRV